MIGTALAVLLTAGVALATINTYSATLTFKPSVKGTKKAPAPIGFTENLGASNMTSGSRAAPLIDIKTTIYGMVANAKSKAFATCSDTVISAAPKFDAACPTGSLVGTGPVTAILGGPVLTVAGTPCNTFLHVYNAGGNKLWFFFTTKSAADCGGLTTGQTAPYPGFFKQSGKNLVIDVPLPSFVSTAVAGHQGLYGSLVKEILSFPKKTAKLKGKTIGYMASTGCKAGKRPYTVAFTSTSSSGTNETATISKSASC